MPHPCLTLALSLHFRTPHTELIFEPRFTTKHGRVRFGLGLGMGLAKSVVDAHGGIIAVDSRPGRTRVTVRLPAEPPRRAPERKDQP